MLALGCSVHTIEEHDNRHLGEVHADQRHNALFDDVSWAVLIQLG